MTGQRNLTTRKIPGKKEAVLSLLFGFIAFVERMFYINICQHVVLILKTNGVIPVCQIVEPLIVALTAIQFQARIKLRQFFRGFSDGINAVYGKIQILISVIQPKKSHFLNHTLTHRLGLTASI